MSRLLIVIWSFAFIIMSCEESDSGYSKREATPSESRSVGGGKMDILLEQGSRALLDDKIDQAVPILKKAYEMDSSNWSAVFYYANSLS